MRFLIVRFGAIGDSVMTAWAATSIRRTFPEAELHWAIESRCAPVLDRERLLNQVHEFPRDRWKAHRLAPNTLAEQVRAYLGLRHLQFDYGIDFQGHSKTAICLRLANPKRRIAARATDPLARRLNPTLDEPPDIHIVDWNQTALRTFGDFELPERPIMPRPAEWAFQRGCGGSPPQKISDSNQGGAGGNARQKPFDNRKPTDAAAPCNPNKVTLSVGAGHAAKKYPTESWKQVAKNLTDRGYEIVALGGPEELGLGQGPGDLVGRLSLAETLHEVATSALHLAADTGTGHMAAAYGVPVVSIFGSMMDPAKYRPYGKLVTVLRSGDNPADVAPDDVLEAALRYLEP